MTKTETRKPKNVGTMDMPISTDLASLRIDPNKSPLNDNTTNIPQPPVTSAYQPPVYNPNSTTTTSQAPMFPRGNVVVHGSELTGNATYDYTIGGQTFKGLDQNQWNAIQQRTGSVGNQTTADIRSLNERNFLGNQAAAENLRKTPLNQYNLTPEQ